MWGRSSARCWFGGGLLNPNADYFGIGPALLSARTDAAKVTRETAARTNEVAMTRKRAGRRIGGSFSQSSEREDAVIVGGSNG
jgi:hypothetical protein